MEVRPGYKLTEVGIIPEEWVVKTLASLGTFSKGQGIRKDEAASGNLPCIRYGEIYTHHNDIVRNYNSYISPTVARTSKRLCKGDILFAGSGETKEEIGKAVAFVNEDEAYAGGDIVILSARSAVPEFLGYLLNSPIATRQKSSKGQGDAIVHISARALGAVAIPVPPILEQRAIATALSDVDALLAALDRLIAKKRDLKHAAMQQLLTGQTRLLGFSGEWDILPLSKTTRRITRGASPRPIDSPQWFDDRSNVGWVRISDVTLSHRYLEETTQRLSDAGVRNSRFVHAGSLIMSICATVGRPIETRIDSCIHDGFVVFEQPQVNQSFLYHVLAHIETTWSRSGQTGSQMNLNTGIINNRLVAIPRDDEEQSAIAAVLSDMDTEIAALEARRAKTRDLKQAMMQELLTGRTRLV